MPCRDLELEIHPACIPGNRLVTSEGKAVPYGTIPGMLRLVLYIGIAYREVTEGGRSHLRVETPGSA